MIRLKKQHNYGLTIDSIFFPATVDEMPAIRPWSYFHCKQASQDILTAFAPAAIQVHPFHTITLDLSLTRDQLWQAITKARREKIRQGERMPLTVTCNQMSADQAYRMLTSFCRSREILCPTSAYFNMLAAHGDLWAVTRETQYLAFELTLRDYPRRARAMYACHNCEIAISSTDRSAINSLLCWHEMQHYRQERFACLDWGGIFTDHDSPYYGITRFKASFGGATRQEWNMVLAGAAVRPLLRWKPFKQHLSDSTPT